MKYLSAERLRPVVRATYFCGLVLLVCVFLSVSGCGSGGDGAPDPQPTPSPSGVQVSVSPVTANVAISKTLALAATVQNAADTRVLWRVDEGAAGGTVDNNGLYTAPDHTGTYHVSAVSLSDAARFATATLTVVPLVRVAPEAAILSIGGTQAFTAVVDGTSDQRVTWAVREGSAGGSVSDTGVYTAPANPGTFHIVAASFAQPQQAVEIVVIVKSGGTEVSIQ